MHSDRNPPSGTTQPAPARGESTLFRDPATLPFARIIRDDSVRCDVRCPLCGGVHQHSSGEGTRAALCTNAEPGDQYYISRFGSTEPLRAWGS